MKILFITDLYPVQNDEQTTPRTLYHYVRGFEKQGVSVNIIKPNFILNSFLRSKPFYKTGTYENVQNINYWFPFCGDISKKISSDFMQKDYSVIVSHMPSGSIFAYKLARKLDLPLVCGVHVSDLAILTQPLYSIYFKQTLLKAFTEAKFLACRSFVIKDKLCSLYPEFSDKCCIMPSGIPQNTIIDRSDDELNKNNMKIVTCANFKKRKNIDLIIKACKQIKNVELTVIGDGKNRQKLEKIDKNVKFTGRLEQSRVTDIMRESDVFILPSINETLGMVYLEAMAANCITVCTKNDGIDGIIKNGENGFLVTPSVEDIINVLHKIQNTDNDSIKRLRNNTFTTIQQYTDTKMCENYLQQIFKIL